MALAFNIAAKSVGRLIPAGTGFTYHKYRKQAREDLLKQVGGDKLKGGMTASEVEYALSEALNLNDGNKDKSE